MIREGDILKCTRWNHDDLVEPVYGIAVEGGDRVVWLYGGGIIERGQYMSEEAGADVDPAQDTTWLDYWQKDGEFAWKLHENRIMIDGEDRYEIAYQDEVPDDFWTRLAVFRLTGELEHTK